MREELEELLEYIKAYQEIGIEPEVVLKDVIDELEYVLEEYTND